MKLRPDQLPQALKTKLAPLYWISGDEPLLVQETKNLIKNSALKNGHSDVQKYTITTHFDWNVLIFDSQNLSLFGDKKLIEIQLDSQKIDDDGKKFLSEHSRRADKDSIVLITSDKLDSATQRSAWFKTLENNSVIVQVWPIDKDKLPQWIHQRMASVGLSPTAAATRIIAENTEGNLLASSQEIEKLRLLHGEGPINEDQVLAAISDNARYDVFQLIDCIELGQQAKALKTLTSLKEEGQEATLILWTLCRELRSLSQFAKHLEAGCSLQQLFQEHGVWDKRKQSIQSYLKRFDHQSSLKLLQQAQQVDLAIKGLDRIDPWLRLNQLVANMSSHGNSQLFKA